MSSKSKRSVVVREKNFTLYDDGNFKIENVPLAYPDSLIKAKPVKGNDKPKHTVQVLLSKKTHKAAISALQEYICDKVKEHKFDKLVKLRTFDDFADIPTDKVFMTDGDKKVKDGYDGYWVLSMSSNPSHAPTLRIEGEMKTRRDDADELEEVCVTGTVASVVGSLYMQNDPEWGQRVNCNIVVVNFLNDTIELSIGGSVDDDDMWNDDDDDDDEPKRGKSKPKKSKWDDDDEV